MLNSYGLSIATARHWSAYSKQFRSARSNSSDYGLSTRLRECVVKHPSVPVTTRNAFVFDRFESKNG